jgi:signal peptidase II
VVVALDQATKQLAVSHIERGEHASVFPGLELTNARNTGVAFGALEGAGLIVAILIGLSLALLVGYFVVHRDMPWLWLPVGLLLGGALGNLADRARQGAVIDFIDPVAWPAFNLADACIVIGVVALLYVVEGRQRLTRREAS